MLLAFVVSVVAEVARPDTEAAGSVPVTCEPRATVFCTASVPRPRLVLAVETMARSERLLAASSVPVTPVNPSIAATAAAEFVRASVMAVCKSSPVSWTSALPAKNPEGLQIFVVSLTGKGS